MNSSAGRKEKQGYENEWQQEEPRTREEDDEGLSFLRALIDDEGHYLQQEEEILSQYRSRLQQPAEFTDFIANYPQVSVQQFRQFLRRYAQNNDRKAKQKLDSVLISLLFPTAWV